MFENVKSLIDNQVYELEKKKEFVNCLAKSINEKDLYTAFILLENKIKFHDYPEVLYLDARQELVETMDENILNYIINKNMDKQKDISKLKTIVIEDFKKDSVNEKIKELLEIKIGKKLEEVIESDNSYGIYKKYIYI